MDFITNCSGELRLKGKYWISFIISLLLITFLREAIGSQIGYTPMIEGSGKFIRNTLQIPSLKKLEVSGIANVYIKQSNVNELLIEAEDNIVPALIHSIQGNLM